MLTNKGVRHTSTNVEWEIVSCHTLISRDIVSYQRTNSMPHQQQSYNA